MYGRFYPGVTSRLLFAVVCLAASADSAVFLPRYTNASCSANCTAFDVIGKYYWQKQQVTATLTAATIVYIIDDRTNKTRTSTKTNVLPAGVTPPPVNAKGTHVTTFAVETAQGQSSVVVLAYPTAFIHYPWEYGWYGTLPTVDSSGHSTCSVVDEEKTTQYVTYNPYPTPAQQSVDTVDPADPSGYIYSLMGYGCYEPANPTLNPNDAAPKLCTGNGFCGISALATVQFLTDTSTSHESSTPESTPPQPPPPPPATSSAGQAQQTTSPQPPPPPPPPTPPATSAGGNSNTARPPTVANEQPPSQPQTPAPIVVGSQTVSANAQSNFVIAGQTLAQGSQIVAGGTTISLAQGGSFAVVNGATQPLVTAKPAASPALVVNGQTVTANSAGQLVVGGSTLSIGSAVTLGSGASRTTISLTTGQGGQTVAVVNGKSSTLAPSSTGGIGNAIASGLGSTGGGPEQFTGGSSRSGRSARSAMLTPLLGLLVQRLLNRGLIFP